MCKVDVSKISEDKGVRLETRGNVCGIYERDDL